MTVRHIVFNVAGKIFPPFPPTMFVNQAVAESNKCNHTFSPVPPNVMCVIALNNNVIHSFFIWSVYIAYIGS